MSLELPFPEPGETLQPAGPSRETLTRLARRRSILAKTMTEPGPDEAETEALIALASRTPDHGKLFPWRFLVFRGEARGRFGELLEARLRQSEPDGPEERYHFERTRFERAPLVIAVVSEVTPEHKIPEWEQVLSAGAVCFNMLVAAEAMGYGAQWLTEWYAYDAVIGEQLGLGAHERVAGFIYVGTPGEPPTERPRKAPRIAEWERQEVRSERLPTLDASLGYGYARSESESGFLQSSRSYDLTYGLTLSFDVFDGFNRRRRLENASVRQRNAELIVEDVRAQLDADLTSAYTSYQNRLELVALEQENLDAAAANPNLVVVAATNRKAALDPALLRPGRLEPIGSERRGPVLDELGNAELRDRLHEPLEPVSRSLSLPEIWRDQLEPRETAQKLVLVFDRDDLDPPVRLYYQVVELLSVDLR